MLASVDAELLDMYDEGEGEGEVDPVVDMMHRLSNRKMNIWFVVLNYVNILIFCDIFYSNTSVNKIICNIVQLNTKSLTRVYITDVNEE